MNQLRLRFLVVDDHQSIRKLCTTVGSSIGFDCVEAESAEAAALMGTKTVLNEFVAYLDLAKLPGEALGPRARLIVTYALCGFANFGSLGILVGGLGAMVPERRREITELGLRSIVSGTIATCTSGAIAGLLQQ